MTLKHLTAEEQDIVLACMKATAVHVADWEKPARLGLEADELTTLIAEWPNIDDTVESGRGAQAINGCLNEVCHGFRLSSDEWRIWFDVSRDEVKRIYQKWLDSEDPKAT